MIDSHTRPALVCTKDEADCFSLCWNDVVNGKPIQRQGTRLYPLEREKSVVEFLTREGVDPVVVYRKRQEPIIEPEVPQPEPKFAEPQQPLAPEPIEAKPEPELSLREQRKIKWAPTVVPLVINPRTGKGWTDNEELVISQIMLVEQCPRMAAIQRARSRGLLIGETDGSGYSVWKIAGEHGAEPGQALKPTKRTAEPRKSSNEVPEKPPTAGTGAKTPKDRAAGYGDRAKTPVAVNGQTEPEPIAEPHTVIKPGPNKGGRPPKWKTDAIRKAAARAQQSPLKFPDLPEGVYRAREVLTPKCVTHEQRGRRNYHATLQGNRCFFCERLFGIYVQRGAGRPEQLRIEDEHFIPRRLPGSRKDENRHAVCHICNRLKSDLVFQSEEQCRSWLAEAWKLNGYQELSVRAIQYLGSDSSVLFEEKFEEKLDGNLMGPTFEPYPGAPQAPQVEAR